MTLNYKITLWILLQMLAHVLCAQIHYGSIEGQFYSKDLTGDWVPTWNVNLYIDGRNASYSWTKPGGLFRIDSLAEGTHEAELISTGGGYVPVKQKFRVVANTTQTLKLYLGELKYSVYINVFKPIYDGDTVIFPTPGTCAALMKKYRIADPEVKDAVVTIKEYETQKDVAIAYDKALKAYYLQMAFMPSSTSATVYFSLALG